ncbi:hypothetical protein [Sporolactobacillus sp. CQH2019]|uniref:hypothetical protein n=1 Tax=Sporolactobacillus sp. CQH2019 TaxID=3023512 RepID=UPI00308394BE
MDKYDHTVYNARWIDKNKDHKRYLSKRSAARSFINKDANSGDLMQLSKLINDRWGKMTDYEKLNVYNSTIFDWEDKELRTTGSPYIDGVESQRPIYKAIALDVNGNKYEVIWDVYDGWKEITDESEMCDWDHPERATRL